MGSTFISNNNVEGRIKGKGWLKALGVFPFIRNRLNLNGRGALELSTMEKVLQWPYLKMTIKLANYLKGSIFRTHVQEM